MRSACSRNRLLLEGSMNSTPVKGVLNRRFESAFQTLILPSQNKHERSLSSEQVVQDHSPSAMRYLQAVISDGGCTRGLASCKRGSCVLWFPENYRPISLTCITCKIMEHIIASNIMSHASDNNILYPLQHGFRAKKSCELQLIGFISDLINNMEENKQTGIIVTDFSTAFDKVGHKRLLHKLQYYWVRGQNIRWITNFLTNRGQRVVLFDTTSSDIEVESGVPQGSVLGPCLFLFYINDLPAKMSTSVRLSADDTIIYMTI